MIRLRRMLERGSAHPVFGPILLVVVVLLLAMVFLHVAGEGWDAAIGTVCLGIATVLGLVLLERTRDHLLEPLISVRGDRGPPRPSLTRLLLPIVSTNSPGSLPLRR